ncbi:glycoside hydrolase family 3 C-terminal domain-containing protein [Planococcus sp. N028]|uniref:Glycoside hydrolase family 3 C-terminal domain-containing protein n=1 Tax=Planococcus shixiaomingii TaxID=3058393 RepID=A0ABT8N5K8_9BACL|nr:MULTISPECIES: glycoside hydrolase family 3 C-terminal domain-containing protein [unclassified Planococcus (in: firmicutes)]MDN7242932.1 glycoside hydrolase family 3 C-terminal domain-containing protein [Planococcus sp. N028]WKA55444.1 glycoside hydrolase family 3 C-terminal domain-containing protein [Planococcus sp. N022]
MERDIKDLISKMSLREKVSMCTGVDFWHLKGIERLGIPKIRVGDGPHGLRKQIGDDGHMGLGPSEPATCFPAGATLASSWDKGLIREVGSALGKEAQAEGITVLLGPGVNIKRSPLCGRNFEYYSEDPHLSSELATSYIHGVQSEGVGTSLKHYVANNQEHRRMTTNAIIDERALREIYLSSFENAVKNGKPWTVMASYNRVNYEFVSESPFFLQEVLRNEWGFDGIVMSDWGAIDERAEALAAGLDLEMPNSLGFGEKKLLDAIEHEKLSMAQLDQVVERLLKLIFHAHSQKKEGAKFNQRLHHELARRAAVEGMVLLKNDDEVLPLSKDKKIALIGAFAKEPRYQGGGSSHVNPLQLDNLYDEMACELGGEDKLLYADGYDLHMELPHTRLIEEAIATAEKADCAVLMVGLPDRYESEGYDRTHLRIPDDHQLLIKEVAKVQPNLIVVLSNGAPVEMPWLDKAKGLLEAYLGGQAVGSALKDILFGYANPSGKLAETFPVKLSDNPSYLHFPGDGNLVEYKEGIFVGYRYYDTKERPPLFPFGYGLSYTEFEYSSLIVDDEVIKDTDELKVQVTVKNTGDRAGKEIVQLYVSDLASTMRRPLKELKGFEKVELQPGEEQVVEFTLNKRSFAYYNTEIKDWHVETGEYEILVGKSSAEIELAHKIIVQSTVRINQIVNRNTTIGELMADSLLAEPATELIKKMNSTPTFLDSVDESKEMAEMMEALTENMPLRALVFFTKGSITEEELQYIIDELNKIQTYSTTGVEKTVK